MTTCRWSREAEQYLTPEGEPCKVDAYGDPTTHCTAKPSCSWHVGRGEFTCARCLAGARRDLAWIATLSALLPAQAIADGIESEAVNLAGPSVNPEAWSWRKATAKATGRWHASLIEDDDERHPHRVLGTWAHMLSEDYGHDMPPSASLSWCASYLARQLHIVAQDPEQDFALMRRELRKCRQHLEAVLHNADQLDRGAPCPDCTSEENGLGPRLVRMYGHWCTDETCERLHHADDGGDSWVCMRNRDHWWSHHDYERWIEERGKKLRSRTQRDTTSSTTLTEATA